MKMIWVTFRKAGLHFYPAAGTQGLEDVGYLAHSHRHLFHFKVQVEVFHDDREIEFHQFLNYVESKVTTDSLQNKSCEMICHDVAGIVAEKYSLQRNRKLIVEVSEDGECGAVIEYDLEGGSVFA